MGTRGEQCSHGVREPLTKMSQSRLWFKALEPLSLKAAQHVRAEAKAV